MATVNQTFRAPGSLKTGKTSANVLRWVRQVHLWLGVFFAPAIIFFAFTGALQTLNLHEAQPGSTYQPPLWIEKLAQLHKKQNLQVRPKRKGPPEPARPEAQARRSGDERLQQPPVPSVSTYLMKWFVLLMSLGLITTSLLGVYMAFQYNRSRRLIWTLLVLGTVVPVLFMR
ncbi:MAG: PepSY domain-containing protein [Acidobacteriaceae bacterium]|nr:PepSY domain-containing protein [Acidobacteriaceae bacterium]MBV9224533.1 PepSY domain-containing protein [Acidobacteriaceae bacterium]MBV9308093.1 PepSY domain-containing protein [Acidobacteriaceae bacterium]MBV9677565.1 PepSY domain-containing protein [Acidobacteriaceae bacterium]